MNIERRYWKWDGSLNSTGYALGERIDPLLSSGLVKESDEGPNVYTGVGGVPWKIKTADGIIVSVFYQRIFFPLSETDIWDLERKDLERHLNGLLQPVVEDDECDKLVIVFRESFVAIAGLVSFRRVGN